MWKQKKWADRNGRSFGRSRQQVCIEAVLNEGRDETSICMQTRIPEYQRLYRQIWSLQKRKQLQKSVCFFACEMILYLVVF